MRRLWRPGAEGQVAGCPQDAVAALPGVGLWAVPAPQALPVSQAAPAEVHTLSPAPRVVLEPRRPWKEAGRSTDAAARACRPRGGDRRHADRSLAQHEHDLRLLAGLQRAVARRLDGMRAAGCVLLHDRVVRGTGEYVDTIVIGPGGLLVLRVRSVGRLEAVAGGAVRDAESGLVLSGAAARSAGDTVRRRVSRELDKPRLVPVAHGLVVAPRDIDPVPPLPGDVVLLTDVRRWAASRLGASTGLEALSASDREDLVAAVERVCSPARV